MNIKYYVQRENIDFFFQYWFKKSRYQILIYNMIKKMKNKIKKTE